jgi:Zn-dependent peptidase ImmA (M78 family)/DNA-binding XRE family transcriptional regulator
MAAASAHDISMNIRRARAAAGMTQEAAAVAVGLSRAAYRNLESGESEPRARTLVALASGLRVKLEALLRPARPLPRARFRSLKRLNDREGLLIDVAQQLEDYEDLEDLLAVRPSYALGDVEIGNDGEDGRAIRAARIVRSRLGLGEDEPVRDIGGLLEERAGIKLLRLDAHTDAFFGLSVREGDGGPAVVVNMWDRISVERWIFTAAHELGHLILHHQDFDPGQSDEIEESEREANVFAGHFLMPDGAFRREWDQSAGLGFYGRVLKVKRIFHVSYKTVLYRLQEDYGMRDVWQRFQVDARRQTGKMLTKSDEPDALSRDAFGWGNPEPSKAREPGGLVGADFAPDRRYRLVREAVERGRISLARGGEILDLPLAKMKVLKASWI